MRKVLVTVALIISTIGLYAQTTTYKSGSVLWKISGKDLKTPSYLLGTLHLKSGEYFDTIPGAKAAFKSCEQVVGEIDMSNMLEAQMKMQQATMMSPDTTYQMLYSDEEYSLVNEKIVSLAGAGLEQLGVYKPVAIQQIVVQYAYMKYFSNNPTNGLDAQIQSDAQKDQKTVIGLETVDDNLQSILTMSLKRQAELLLCYLNNMDKVMSVIPEIISVYDRWDLNRMLDLDESGGACPSTQAEEDAVIKDRNYKWMTKLPEIMKSKSSYIAVGAMHLAGKDGLLNLLEKAGYKVEPVGIESGKQKDKNKKQK
jgi:uncharacterized protein YbaP (TraB family)